MRAGLGAVVVVVDTVFVRSKDGGRRDTTFRISAPPAAVNILAIEVQEVHAHLREVYGANCNDHHARLNVKNATYGLGVIS